MREYDWGRHGKTRMLVEAVEGATICPEITIHANFEWLKADGLFIGIRYGSPEYEIQLWIPKPQEGPASSERSDWTFQIPGKCAGSTVVGRGRVYHVYQFGQAQVCPHRLQPSEHLADPCRAGPVAGMERKNVPISKKPENLSSTPYGSVLKECCSQKTSIWAASLSISNGLLRRRASPSCRSPPSSEPQSTNSATNTDEKKQKLSHSGAA